VLLFRTHRALLRFLTVCYLAVMGLYVFQGQLWQIHYLLHKETIARVYCENRNNALMHCEGKCYLHKKLLAAEANDAQKASTLPEIFFLPWFFQKIDICLELPAVEAVKEIYPLYLASLRNFAVDVFPPPPKA